MNEPKRRKATPRTRAQWSGVAACNNATQLCNLSVMHARLACPPAHPPRQEITPRNRRNEKRGELGREGGRDAWLVFISNQGSVQFSRRRRRRASTRSKAMRSCAHVFCTSPSVVVHVRVQLLLGCEISEKGIAGLPHLAARIILAHIFTSEYVSYPRIQPLLLLLLLLLLLSSAMNDTNYD